MEFCYFVVGTTGPCLDASAWAAWAQAILTVATFAGTVLYQALESRKAATQKRLDTTRTELEVMQLKHARVQAEVLRLSRFLRHWRLIYDRALKADRSTPERSLSVYKVMVRSLADANVANVAIEACGPLASVVARTLFQLDRLREEAHGETVKRAGEDSLENRLEAMWAIVANVFEGVDAVIDSSQKVLETDPWGIPNKF